MEIFEYDESPTFEENFTVRYDMNCRERLLGMKNNTQLKKQESFLMKCMQ